MKAEHRHSLRDWWPLVKAASTAWVADYAPSMGAALSYYSAFSLAPLLLIVISIAGLVFGQDAVRGEVFGQLQDALDRIWRAPARNRSRGLWELMRARLLSFGMIMGIAFLLMVSLVFSAVLAALGKWWSSAFGEWALLAQFVNLVVGFVMTIGVFAMIYKIMPRVSVKWRDVWLGAAVTSLLFPGGRYLIGMYIGRSNLASGFGAAGSLIVVFVWVYYSAQIFLLGAEFTWIYARTFRSMRAMQPAFDAKTGVSAPGFANGRSTPP